MPNQRQGYKRVIGEIPEEMHEIISHYNKVCPKNLNVSKAIEICLSKEIKKIQQEALDFVRDNGGMNRYNDRTYNSVVTDIQAGFEAPEIYRKVMKNFDYKSFKDIESAAYLPLIPVNRMVFKDEQQKVIFLVDSQPVFVITTVEAGLKEQAE
jgi:hypothetical protein